MTSDRETAWTLAELGRLLYTHGLQASLVANALDLNEAGVAPLVTADGATALAEQARGDRAALVLNILVRLEVRCGGDTGAMAAALDQSLDLLGGASIAQTLIASPGLATLNQLREAAGSMPVPKVRMWRVADRYS